MQLTAALAADLTTLSETLDDQGLEIADTLRQLAVDAKLAVRSYLGLTVTSLVSGRPVTLTTLEFGAEPGDILTSLRLPMPPAATDGVAAPRVSVTLYAGIPGAFIDLAADLSWLTGRPLAEFVLDEHRILPSAPDTPSGLAVASLINQAIGVLIGHGYTPERAHRELDARGAQLGLDRHRGAIDILAELTGSAPETS
ncbi:MAG: hypothetical protein ACR2LF_05745 [Jatrophihabitantaceae bacterium]